MKGTIARPAVLELIHCAATREVALHRPGEWDMTASGPFPPWNGCPNESARPRLTQIGHSAGFGFCDNLLWLDHNVVNASILHDDAQVLLRIGNAELPLMNCSAKSMQT